MQSRSPSGSGQRVPPPGAPVTLTSVDLYEVIAQVRVTALPAATIAGPTYRSAGRAAIGSGVCGIMAFGVLIVATNIMFTKRPDLFGLMDLMFKTHHVGIILQYLFMIPVVFGLHTLARERLPGVGRATLLWASCRSR